MPPAASKFLTVRPIASPIAVATGPIGVFAAAASGPVTLASIDGASVALFGRIIADHHQACRR